MSILSNPMQMRLFCDAWQPVLHVEWLFGQVDWPLCHGRKQSKDRSNTRQSQSHSEIETQLQLKPPMAVQPFIMGKLSRK